MIMQVVINHLLTCCHIVKYQISTETQNYAGCRQIRRNVLSRLSIGTQKHNYTGCGQIPLNVVKYQYQISNT